MDYADEAIVTFVRKFMDFGENMNMDMARLKLADSKTPRQLNVSKPKHASTRKNDNEDRVPRRNRRERE